MTDFSTCPTRQSRATLHSWTEQCPIFYEQESLSHFVTRYDDVMALLEDPGMRVSRASNPRIDALPPERRELHRQADDFFEWWPNALDGATHDAIRSTLAPAFTRRHLDPVIACAQARARALLGELSQSPGPVSWTDDFSRPFVYHVLAVLFGVPEDRIRLLTDTVERMLGQLGVGDDLNDNSAHSAIAAIEQFTESLTETLVSATGRLAADLRAMAADPDLGPRIATAAAAQIISGTYVPINTALCEGIIFWQQWRSSGGGAVRPAELAEETLRLAAPFRIAVRYPTEPVEVGTTVVGAGERLTLVIGAANVDESRFSDAMAFRPESARGGHMAFGWGSHYCPGARLARGMLTSMFAWLLENNVEADVDAHSIAASDSIKLAHFTQLKVSFSGH